MAVRASSIFSILMALPVTTVLFSPCLGEIEGNAELLKLVGQGLQSNYESLATWRGKAKTVTHQKSPTFHGQFDERIVQEEMEFAYDSDGRKRLWRSRQTESRVTQDGQTSAGSPGVVVQRGLANDGLLYRLGPMGEPSEKWPLNCDLYDAAGAKKLPDEFDPSSYFTLNRENLAGLCMSLHGRAASPSIRARVRREGDLVVFRVGEGDLTANYSEYVFDISKGCNLVRFHDSPSAPSHWECEIDYAEVSGVFVPSRYFHRYEESSPDGDQVFTTEMSFGDHIVNEPISPSVFELASIGVGEGDKIMDHRTGASYVLGGGATGPNTALDIPTEDAERLLRAPLEEEPATPTPAKANVAGNDVSESPSEGSAAEPENGRLLVLGLALVVAALAVVALLARRAISRGRSRE